MPGRVDEPPQDARWPPTRRLHRLLADGEVEEDSHAGAQQPNRRLLAGLDDGIEAGATCATTGPDNWSDCCAVKARKHLSDPTCPHDDDEELTGATCATTGPMNWKQCCAAKARRGDFTDQTCPREPAGATCATTGPANYRRCCRDKARRHVYDRTCRH